MGTWGKPRVAPDAPEGDSLPCSVGKNGQGDGLPGAGDVDFKQPLESKLGTPRREMNALAPLAGGAGRSLLGLVFGWGLGLVKGLRAL